MQSKSKHVCKLRLFKPLPNHKTKHINEIVIKIIIEDIRDFFVSNISSYWFMAQVSCLFCHFRIAKQTKTVNKYH